MTDEMAAARVPMLNDKQSAFIDRWLWYRSGRNTIGYPLKKCQTMHGCEWCDATITLNQHYRAIGSSQYVHVACGESIDAALLAQEKSE